MTTGRGRVWRHRPRAAIGGVAALAAAALAVPLATPTATDVAAFNEPADSTVTLSMEVQPGDAVPLSMVKEQSHRQYAGRGATGWGVDVAIIDSGVSPVAGLDQPGKLFYGPDLSNEGGVSNLANLDAYGHGTHLAGIIAGDDGDQVIGIAPDSRLVSVKVADATGDTDIAQVIAAIEWVIEHRNSNGLNIRVLNLSLGVPSVNGHVGDPLSAAVERAWKAGIVVVVAAGNRGNDAGAVDSPAVNPYVLGVGAIESYDSWGTTDRIAPWSSGGNAARQADVTAAGKSILSYRVPGSFLDSMYPSAIVGERYFKGSGTSQSAAVVSGYVAALLSRDPYLSPDQVKWLLTREADDMDGGFLDGSGKIDMDSVGKRSQQAWKARAQRHESSLPTGMVHSDAEPTWTGGSWSGASWSGGSWSGASWSGASWSGASWSGASWSGGSWSGASWSGDSWSGASWAGEDWK